MKEFLIIYFAVIFIISLAAFVAYFSDKRRAVGNRWRIKESVLLGLGVFGGAFGALCAMLCFRHKTRHWYFWAVNVIFLAVHIALPVVICIYIF